MLSAKDKIDIMLRLIDKVDALWAAHHVINLGVLGAAFTYGMGRMSDVVVVGLFLLLIYLNAWSAYGLLRSYRFLNLVLTDLRESSHGLFDGVTNELKEAMAQLRYGGREWHVLGTHAVLPMGALGVMVHFAR